MPPLLSTLSSLTPLMLAASYSLAEDAIIASLATRF